MADISGAGFIAGITKSLIKKDYSDDWFHTGGDLVFTGKHEKGFAHQTLAVGLPAGTSDILVKLSNQNNQQWRLWAFNLKFL